MTNHASFCRTYVQLSERSQSSWSVPDLCRAYGWPTSMPGRGPIAIVELGGGWTQSDVDAYFKSLGQPSPTITDVSVDGTTNSKQSPQDDADVEVALDIQVAGAAFFAATGEPANIRIYWSQDIASAVSKAAKDGCSTCSISWGADEAMWGSAAAEQMDAAAARAVSSGMPVFAAAGDNDSSDGGPNPANVDVPASCPHVVGCGGTMKTAEVETVWNDNPGRSNGEGTGGGYSTIFPKQSWQLKAPNPPRHLGRMVPDLAANADPNTGYQITVYGQSQVVGGTSAVAPLAAGLFASFPCKLGLILPTLWANPTSFVDITQGSNGAYKARVGPDPCSGLGAPIGTALARAFAPKVPPPVPAPAPAPAPAEPAK